MSRPSILTSLTAATDIAGEAIFSLGAARKNFAEFEALFRAIGSAAEEHSDLAKLARLGEFSAMDHGNGYDCLREEYELRLEKCTPQSTQPENVARIPVGLEASLADRVLLARESAGLSQADLAKLVGTRQTSISQIESGKTKRTSYLAEIARACLVDIHWLAFGLEGGQ